MFSYVYAATPITDTLAPYLTAVNKYILNPILAFLFVLALAVFFYGIVKFLLNAGSDEARKEGARHMVWGIVGLFIMVSVKGLLHIICNTIGCAG